MALKRVGAGRWNPAAGLLPSASDGLARVPDYGFDVDYNLTPGQQFVLHQAPDAPLHQEITCTKGLDQLVVGAGTATPAISL